ncbi:MAG: hypothetical protein OXE59_06415 [Bacteroidetes bacterium]|nr:hypothetical protein [Bacteroidota bacterium]
MAKPSNDPRQYHQTPLTHHWQIKLLLKGGTVVQAFDDMFDIQSTLPHGHVAAVLGTMEQLKIPELIGPKNSRFRRLVLGMIAAHSEVFSMHPYWRFVSKWLFTWWTLIGFSGVGGTADSLLCP